MADERPKGLQQSTYCPFEVDEYTGVSDLVAMPMDTPYGTIFTRVSREHRSDIATLYIHGIHADWTTWTPLLRAEAALKMDAHDQILVDIPGFGASENRLGSLEIKEVGDTFLSIASSLGYPRIRLVGHSLGGFLALDMASRHVQCVESVHVAAGPFFSIVASYQHPLLNSVRSPTVTASFGSLYALALTGQLGVSAVRMIYRLHMLRLLTYPAARYPFRLKQSVVRSLCEEYRSHALIQAAANGDGYTPDEQWAKIECPISATFGEFDWFVPQKDMKRLLKCRPSARCTIIRQASHLHHIEWPFDTLQALELWD
jgi:pimeloyl-ACP methyl ester carboxylesterase